MVPFALFGINLQDEIIQSILTIINALSLTGTQLNFLELKNSSRSLESSLSYRMRNRAVSALTNLLRNSSLQKP